MASDENHPAGRTPARCACTIIAAALPADKLCAIYGGARSIISSFAAILGESALSNTRLQASISPVFWRLMRAVFLLADTPTTTAQR